MQNSYADYRIRWPDGQNAEEVIFSRINEATTSRAIPFDPSLGSIQLETQQLGLGITVFRWKFSLSKKAIGRRIPFALLESEYPSKSFTVRSVFGGSIGFHDDSEDREIIVGPDSELFSFTDHLNSQLCIYGSPKIELIHFRIPEEGLRQLIGNVAVGTLFNTLELNSSPHHRLKSTPLSIRLPLYSTILEANIERNNNFYVQVKIMEYLAGLMNIDALNSGQEFSNKLNGHLDELHKLLSSINGNSDSLSEIAKHHHISIRTLDAEFKKKFHQSTFTFLLSKRLDEAHLALSTETTALKIISAKSGYSHVSHFSTAFKKKFGYSPGKLRK